MLDEFTPDREPMICGSHEAEVRRYHAYIGKNGKTWLVADQDNSADNIYVEGGPHSDGFGGRTLLFHLVDGTPVYLKGPWHSNSDALLKATGIDITDKHLTYGCVAQRREYRNRDSVQPTLIGILHLDVKPIIGHFDRIEKIAQRFADELGVEVYYYSKSQGGSGCGPVHPAKSKSNALTH